MKTEERERLFVEKYLLDPNGKQAAIAAGYSEKTAAATASRLLTKSNVVAMLNAARAVRSAETQIDANYVLKRLHDENEADLADLYDPETGALLPVHKWPLIWRKGLIQGVDVEELRDEGVTIGVVRKVKISDRIKRTELIGKHVNVQAFSDRLEVNVTDNLAERIARAKKARA